MNTNKRKTVLATMVGLFAAGGMSATMAQGSMGESARAQGVLDEIIVTSTRRETSLQDTALSVAAVDGEEIARRNLSEMNDYLRTLPGINFIDQGVGRNSVVVRGISVDPELEALISGPTVGIYLGEVPLSGLSVAGTSSDLKMIDLQRVEVLRGPQGTLFGSGSLGGAVRNIPNAPNLNELEGSLKTSYSNTGGDGSGNNKLEGVINIPLIDDQLAIRAVAYRHDTSGYVKNIAGTQLATNGIVLDGITAGDIVSAYGGAELFQNKGDVGSTVHEGARLTALWKPRDELSVTLQYATQDSEQTGLPYVQLNTGGYTQVTQQFGGNVPALVGKEEGMIDEVDITNLVIEYDFGWSTLISSSSWVDVTSAQNYDVSSFTGGMPIAQLLQRSADGFIQELRLVSSNEGPFQYVVGAFYEDQSLTDISPGYATADLERNWLVLPGSTDPNYVNIRGRFSLEQFSVYGEFSYQFSEQLELTLGARRFDYDRSTRSDGLGFFGSVVDESGEFDATDTIFKANLSYRPNDNSLIYMQWAEGFRLGNAISPKPVASLCDVNNDGLLDGTNAPIADGFDSDSTENIELGMKLTLLDNQLQVNASVYRVNWTDIPLRIFAGKLPEQEIQTCAFSTVSNAGDAQSQGFEIETVYQLTEQLRLNFGGAYTDVKLKEDFPAGGGFDGDRLPSSPDHQLNFGVQYDFDLAGNSSYIRADYAYVSEFYNKIGELGDKGGDYGQLAMSAGVTLNNFNIEIFGQNLTDEDALTSVGVLEPDTRAYRLRPRTIGLNIGYQF